MKKIINVTDLTILFGMVLLLSQEASVVTTCAVMSLPLIWAAAYHTLVVVCGPLAQSIPIIDGSWLSTSTFNVKVFWQRRLFEAVWSFGWVAVMYWKAEWFRLNRNQLFILVLLVIVSTALVDSNMHRRAK